MAPVLALAGGRYALGDVLGRGGMAQVRQATDTVLGREVAIKLFREDLDEQAAARIRTEMQTLARLSHPGLVGVHDAGTERDLAGVDHPFLVMELVEGPTLADCCRDGALPAERVRRIGAELAAALAYVHECGVVHRDVKPANILLSPTGAKLADFGIARIVDAARHTGTGLTVGTAPYLAPEQVTGDPIGPAADVYALGLVLLECLTGRREYDGSSVETALARLHRQPVVPPDLGAPWPGLLARMTARAPAQRPTAQEVAAALVLPADLAPTDRTAVMASRPPVVATWTVGVAAAVALVAVILLAAGAAQGSSSVRTSPVRVTPSATLAPAGRVLKPVVHPTAHVSPVVGRHGKAKGHRKHG